MNTKKIADKVCLCDWCACVLAKRDVHLFRECGELHAFQVEQHDRSSKRMVVLAFSEPLQLLSMPNALHLGSNCSRMRRLSCRMLARLVLCVWAVGVVAGDKVCLSGARASVFSERALTK